MEWASVKDRKPKDEGHYLTCCTCGGEPLVEMNMWLPEAEEGPGFYRGVLIEDPKLPEITHWMPLPPPPQ